MPQQEGYIRWPTNSKIPLGLALVDGTGVGVTGATPEVSIRRYKDAQGNPLDNRFWDGSGFTTIPQWFPLSEVDSVNNPGFYVYLFDQVLVGLEITYLVHYRHTVDPVGFAAEFHQVTNEVYIPAVLPDPIVIGPQSVMGQLELMKDGGTSQFVPLADSLHFLHQESARILGLLHQNAMVDKQTYDLNNQLTSARLRVFDSAANVPAAPDGTETTGLLQEYRIDAQYAGTGQLKKYTLKRVT